MGCKMEGAFLIDDNLTSETALVHKYTDTIMNFSNIKTSS